MHCATWNGQNEIVKALLEDETVIDDEDEVITFNFTITPTHTHSFSFKGRMESCELCSNERSP